MSEIVTDSSIAVWDMPKGVEVHGIDCSHTKRLDSHGSLVAEFEVDTNQPDSVMEAVWSDYNADFIADDEDTHDLAVMACSKLVKRKTTYTGPVEEEAEEDVEEEPSNVGHGKYAPTSTDEPDYIGPIARRNMLRSWKKHFSTDFEVFHTGGWEARCEILKKPNNKKAKGYFSVFINDEGSTELSFKNSNLTEAEADKLIEAVGGDERFYRYMKLVVTDYFVNAKKYLSV